MTANKNDGYSGNVPDPGKFDTLSQPKPSCFLGPKLVRFQRIHLKQHHPPISPSEQFKKDDPKRASQAPTRRTTSSSSRTPCITCHASAASSGSPAVTGAAMLPKVCCYFMRKNM
jgi:hypothetical protein